MHSPSTSPQRVDTPTSPENISISSDMATNSANSKEETAKPASLGSYAVGYDLLMDPALSVAYTHPSREFYHMVPLMGVSILWFWAWFVLWLQESWVRATVEYSISTNETPGSSIDEYCLWPAGRQIQSVLYSRIRYHRAIIQVLGQSRQVDISPSIPHGSKLTLSF